MRRFDVQLAGADPSLRGEKEVQLKRRVPYKQKARFPRKLNGLFCFLHRDEPAHPRR